MGWQLIQSQSLSASAASVTFSSIPQTYKTLKLEISARDDRATAASDFFRVNVNGDTSAIYSARNLTGDGGTGTASGSESSQTRWGVGAFTAAGATASTFSSVELTFPNYASTTANKVLSQDGTAETNASVNSFPFMGFWAGLYGSNTAISSISVAPGNGTNILFGSTFTLYGLA